MAARDIESCDYTIYQNLLNFITKTTYKTLEETFDLWWDKAEALAGDKLANVQRSRLQWRYLRLMIHLNEEDARALIEDVAAAGLYWKEHYFSPYPTEDSDLNKSPDTWTYQ